VTLRPGVRLGPYEITSQIGAGGMGEVYQALDANLGRQVAIKVMPDAFAADADRLARFDREARTLAALNHPNIAHIYGLERTEARVALVMELVEGETLAERISRGDLPVDEALAIARQIGEALSAAHAQGIVHRDLKPANVKVSRDGTVKVLDFGLAKALEPITAGYSSLSMPPTITSPAMTQAGIVLGTAAYMSPEQARGKAVDRRTDIWAFGCVLYEMLTGKRAFEGDEVSDTFAAVLRGEPDWTAVPAALPPGIARLLRRCLEKDPKRRLHDIADAQILTEEIADARRATPNVRRRSWKSRAARAVAAVVVFAAGAAAALLAIRMTTQSATVRVERYELLTSPDGAFTTSPPGRNIALSPDGLQVVYPVQGAGGWQLALRRLDRLEQTILSGTQAGTSPVFSPDGAQIAFVSRRRLLRVPAGGGAVTHVTDLSADLVGLSWDFPDTILFAETGKGLFRVAAAAGSKPERIAAPVEKKGELDYVSPQLLRGGEVLLFTVLPVEGTSFQSRIVARVLATGADTILVEGGGPGRYVPTGHLVYHQTGMLMAASFNVARLSIGSSAPVQPAIQAKVTTVDGAAANFSVSADGSLIYVPGRTDSMQHVIWVDRRGVRLGSLTDERLLYPRYPRLSPDGRRLVITTGPANEGNVWIYDLTGASQPLKLTFKGHNTQSVWSPTGTDIVFSSTMTGPRNLFRLPSDASRLEPERLTMSPNIQVPQTWSPTGNDVLFREQNAGRAQLWRLPLTGNERKATLLFETDFTEDEASFSPNGKWIAYVTDQTGSSEVVVRPFPGPGSPVRVSPGGGHDPVWSRDGRELFYQNDGRLMAAEIVTTDQTLRVKPPRQLFQGGFVPYVSTTPRSFDVAADGKFVMIEPAQDARPAALILVKNFSAELKRLVPVD
jgi:Tol biopolymer transport system component